MKKIKTFLTAAAILAAITQSAYAAEIPVESAPENATTECTRNSNKSARKKQMRKKSLIQ